MATSYDLWTILDLFFGKYHWVPVHFESAIGPRTFVAPAAFAAPWRPWAMAMLGVAPVAPAVAPAAPLTVVKSNRPREARDALAGSSPLGWMVYGFYMFLCL